jgi:CheY-like chemotaxis protein
MMKKNRPVHILLVEDNPGDIRLVQETFKENMFPHQLYIANDGIEALDFLSKRGRAFNLPYPDIILLDLEMPRMNGWQFLVELKKDHVLSAIPVIILSGSFIECEEPEIISLGIHCSINKPISRDIFIRKLLSLKNLPLMSEAIN